MRYAVVMVLVSVLILVGSVVGNVFYTQSVQKDARAKAEAVRRQQVVTCETTNEARKNNKELWDFLFTLPPSRPRTPAQQQQIKKFRDLVDETFAPRDCTQIR